MPAGTENVSHDHREDLPTAEGTTAEGTTAKSTPARSTPARSTTTVLTRVPATSHSQGKKSSHPSMG